jgi:hypothetical protein
MGKEHWMTDYNEVHPSSRLEYRFPQGVLSSHRPTCNKH